MNFVFMLICFFFSYPACSASDIPSILQEANINYLQGEQATLFNDRKLAFNKALFFYHTVEEQIGDIMPELNQAIGNSYFQLEQYPWAMLYYQRALKLQVDQPDLMEAIKKTYQKLGLQPEILTYTLQQKLLLDPYFPLSKRYALFFWLFLFTFFISSLAIWGSYNWITYVAKTCAGFLVLILLNLLFSYYSVPLEAILVDYTGFYREPNWQQVQLTQNPLWAGSKVRVLQTTSKGDWLKIINSDGLVSYVPASHLRLI